MWIFLGPLLVILTVSAFATEPYCPEGSESFLKDKNISSCDSENVGPKSPNLKPLHFFDIRKSYNAKNLLVVYSQVTNDCKFPETNHPQELVDLYWRMNEGTKKVCKKESAVKERIRAKIRIHNVSEDRRQMTIYLDDLDKVTHDLPDRAATITLLKEKDTCRAQISFSLSSNDKNKKLNLRCVYGEPVMLFFGIPAPVEEVEAITLFGTDENGKPISKRYSR